MIVEVIMYHFILNPTASSGKGRKVWEEIKPVLTENRIDYKVYAFHDANEMSSFVKELTSAFCTRNGNTGDADGVFAGDNARGNADEELCHLVVLGGDGTLNIVLNSIEDFEHTRLSCIRVGSGNDFARNVGIAAKPREALIHLLNEPEELVIDYGEVSFVSADAVKEGQDNALIDHRVDAADREDTVCTYLETEELSDVLPKRTRRFIISSGIGYDADICEEVSRSRLKKILNFLRLGKLVYTVIGIKQIFNKDRARVKLYLDDDEPIRIGSLMFAVAMIHEKEGGGVPFCPHADATDGQLELCIVKNAPAPKLLLEVAMVYIRKHILFSNVREMRCKRLRISADRSQWLHTDGETPCKVKDAVFTCHHGLRVVK